MNMLASGFAQFINGIFANWQMILFALLAVLLILVIVFRKVKVIKFIGIIAVPVILITLSVSLGLAASQWTEQEVLDFAVRWTPTIAFASTVVFHTWLNSWRGLRKSLILLLHSVVIGAVCIIAYTVLVNVPEVDAFMLKMADLFAGGSFKQAMGVTYDCYGLKDVLVCWLPTVLQGDWAIMLGGSAAYVYTLADLIYHISFASILLLIYYILIFIMYMIYLYCYPVSDYKIKRNAKFVENKVDKRYSRNIIGGGVVGLVRGVAIGLLSLSFAGSSLYMVAGLGNGKYKDFDYDFGNDNYNYAFSVYRSLESYGSYGIYKVLNAISSDADVPYYLFAADLVFSGELNDEQFGVSGNVNFREEINAYRAFAMDTMELLIKYGGDDIKTVINGSATDKTFDTVVKVMSEEGFRYEFTDLINEFDTQTYIINFALSFVNAAIANIDSMSFANSVSPDNRELLKIMFTKGYMSDVIPDERIIKNTLGGAGIIFERPYINISKLITKQDAQKLFNIVLDVMTNKTTTLDETLDLIGRLIPDIQSLSMLSADRTKEFNPVLGRLYCYAANRYLSEEGSEGITYAEIYEEKIDWVGEINSLIGVADSAMKLFNNVYVEGGQPQDMLLTVFDKTDKNYKDNCIYYDKVCDSIIKSRLLGKALSTSYIYNNIVKALQGVFKDAYVPADTVYESRFDSDGKLVSAGETYLVLNAVRIIGRQTDLLPEFVKFSSDNIGGLVEQLAEALVVKDENGRELSTYFVQSNLLRSVISAALINSASEYVYVPTFAREINADGEHVCYIEKTELTVLLNSFSELSKLILPVIDGGDAMDAFIEFTHGELFDKLLEESTVFEGTVGKLLVEYFGNDGTVIIPVALKEELDGWASERGRQGEIKNLLNAFKVIGLELDELADHGLDTDKVIDNVLALTADQLDEALKSSVMHYTLSNQLIKGIDLGSFSLIVPHAARQELTDDSISGLVKKSEIQCILRIANELEFTEETEISQVLTKLVANKSALAESYILSASMAYSLVNEQSIREYITIPQVYEVAASKEKLENLNSSNPWKTEIVRFIDALDDIMGISASDSFSFDDMSDNMSQFLKDMNSPSAVNGNVSRLTLCYASQIIAGSITGELDDILEGKVDAALLSGAKSANGNYTEKELSSLSGALNIFDIDVMNVNADELTEKIKGRILELNEPAEGYEGKSTLEVIYPSVIISGMLSSELDSVLLDGEDEEGNPAPMIDAEVLSVIRNGRRYPQKEISQMINSVKEFGINSFDEIENLDFNDIKGKQDKIDDICLSNIIKGVLTLQISKNNEIGADHPLAYEKELKVFKTQEIKSLVKLVDEVSSSGSDVNLEEMYFDDIKLSDLKEAVFTEDGEVQSYLVLSAVSGCILRNGYLLVNTELVDSYECVQPAEVLALIDAFTALEGEEISLGKWSTESKGFAYPDEKQRETAFRSELVRAKLTEQLITANANVSGGTDNFIKASNFTQFTDRRTREQEGVISYSQMLALFKALDWFNVNGSFEIPTISILQIKADYNAWGEEAGRQYVETLYAADVLRYKICDSIMKLPYAQDLETTEEEAVNLVTYDMKVKNVLTFEQVMQIVEM